LIWNALLASALLCAFGLFRPTTPEFVIIATLLVSGCCRSLQFTSLNAISYADVDSRRRNGRPHPRGTPSGGSKHCGAAGRLTIVAARGVAETALIAILG
jgi:hypothetical protein